MEDEMPKVAEIKSQTLTREETSAILGHIAQDASQGAAQVNLACIALSKIMLMQDVGLDRTPLYPHFEALIAARDEMIRAVVQLREALDELEESDAPEDA
ncbi:MAG: hypothetical protein ACLFVO_14565 [Chloroflexaceae bacterium]